eukprot:TRINITY_DN5865_c0_g1_i1.p1 TRINITY_DN5865_c0_g1~~TRINITY_DN5865_c0_g1_i1.p1  ORF type:complete len:809 (+),score=27.39 TRINITY_DN5865_c0_g1_i1:29-2455(+)
MGGLVWLLGVLVACYCIESTQPMTHNLPINMIARSLGAPLFSTLVERVPNTPASVGSTYFVPSDRALLSLPPRALSLLQSNVSLLSSLLRYHSLLHEYNTTSICHHDEGFLETLLPTPDKHSFFPVRVSCTSGSVRINGGLLSGETATSSGHFFLIDTLLIPPYHGNSNVAPLGQVQIPEESGVRNANRIIDGNPSTVWRYHTTSSVPSLSINWVGAIDISTVVILWSQQMPTTTVIVRCTDVQNRSAKSITSSRGGSQSVVVLPCASAKHIQIRLQAETAHFLGVAEVLIYEQQRLLELLSSSDVPSVDPFPVSAFLPVFPTQRPNSHAPQHSAEMRAVRNIDETEILPIHQRNIYHLLAFDPNQRFTWFTEILHLTGLWRLFQADSHYHYAVSAPTDTAFRSRKSFWLTQTRDSLLSLVLDHVVVLKNLKRNFMRSRSSENFPRSQTDGGLWATNGVVVAVNKLLAPQDSHLQEGTLRVKSNGDSPSVTVQAWSSDNTWRNLCRSSRNANLALESDICISLGLQPTTVNFNPCPSTTLNVLTSGEEVERQRKVPAGCSEMAALNEPTTQTDIILRKENFISYNPPRLFVDVESKLNSAVFPCPIDTPAAEWEHGDVVTCAQDGPAQVRLTQGENDWSGFLEIPSIVSTKRGSNVISVNDNRVHQQHSLDASKKAASAKSNFNKLCSLGFRHEDADVVCRQLGFFAAATVTTRPSTPTHGKQTTSFSGSLECTGAEHSLQTCPGHSALKKGACSSAVYIVCQPFRVSDMHQDLHEINKQLLQKQSQTSSDRTRMAPLQEPSIGKGKN